MPSIVRSRVVAIGLALAAIASLSAQERPAPQKFAAGTELVLVDFVVTDKADHPVKGLTAKDFVVKEDGKERPIVSFDAFASDSVPASASPDTGAAASDRAASQLPRASTVILVDDNQLSQQQAARLRPAFKGLIAKTAEPSGALMLVAPGSRISRLGQIPANTAALAAAADHFLDARGLQGISGYSNPETSTLLRRNADEGPFGFWQAASGSMALADETGGLSISNSNDMEKGLGHLLDTMRTYYVLAYQPPAHDKPGYRKIKVEVKTKGLQVRARHGYFSGAPAAR